MNTYKLTLLALLAALAVVGRYVFQFFPFDTAHAIGNAVFILLLYPLLHGLFQRYSKNRFRMKY